MMYSHLVAVVASALMMQRLARIETAAKKALLVLPMLGMAA